MRPLLLLLAVAACSKPQAAPPPPPPAATDAAPEQEAATAVYSPPSTPAARPAPPRIRHRITLRSTPPGAEVAIDGRPVGTAPLVIELDGDGRAREFTFHLPGHEMARYRFPVIRDGVVHGTLRPVRERERSAYSR